MRPYSPLHAALMAAYMASPLTQAQVAARADVSPRTVWAALRGYPVRHENLIKVCRVFDLVVETKIRHSATSREIHA